MNRKRRFYEEEYGGWYAARGKVHEEYGIKEEQVGACSIRSMMDRAGGKKGSTVHDGA